MYSNVQSWVDEQLDLDSCKASMMKIFKTADLDHNGIISRCENAKFLVGIGNTGEYALQFSEMKTLPGLYSGCYSQFPETMDMEEEMMKMMMEAKMSM